MAHPDPKHGTKRKAGELEDDEAPRQDREGKQQKKSHAEAETPPQQSPLLKLPPELRNSVYRYALVEPKNIKVRAGALPPPQPGLLQTCSQARREATKIYYNENCFFFEIVNCDGSTYIKWIQSTQARWESRIAWSLRSSTNTNWVNLLVWLEAFYRRHCDGPGKFGKEEGNDAAIVRLFGMVHRMEQDQSMSWTAVSMHLENMHGVMAALKPEWK